MDNREQARLMAVVLTIGERRRQIQMYGHNEDLALEFESWLEPYSNESSREVERTLREDYEGYSRSTGQPSWMHLIREEIAELFAATNRGDAIVEASQVAALCISLIEHLTLHGEDVWPVAT